MSHELLFRADGSASIVFVGEEAWHGFGTKYDGHLTACEAVEIIGSDFEVVSSPNYSRKPDGEIVGVQGSTLWRPPLPAYGLDAWSEIGQVSLEYEPIHTGSVARALDMKGEDGKAITDRWPVSTHGMIVEATKMFFSLDAGEFDVKGNPVRQWVSILDNKIGGGAFLVTVGGTRVVCDNTFRIAASEANITSDIRHVTGAADAAAATIRLLAQAQKAMESVKETCERMADRVIDADELDKLLLKTIPAKQETSRYRFAQQMEAQGDYGRALFRSVHKSDPDKYLREFQRGEDTVANKRAGVLTAYEMYNSDAGGQINEAHGTAWAFLQGVTGYVDHQMDYSGTPAAKALSQAFGTGDEMKTRAYSAAAKLN